MLRLRRTVSHGSDGAHFTAHPWATAALRWESTALLSDAARRSRSAAGSAYRPRESLRTRCSVTALARALSTGRERWRAVDVGGQEATQELWGVGGILHVATRGSGPQGSG